MKPQSLLFAVENVPHYVNMATRSRVLKSYKFLHRSLARLEDPLAKQQLQLWAQHSFARFKFVTDPRKIEALISYTETHENILAMRAVEGDHRALYTTLEKAYTTYKVIETPLLRVLYTLPSICDKSNPNYRLNNIPAPLERELDAYEEKLKSLKSTKFQDIDSKYWQLVKILSTHKINSGSKGRKLVYKLTDMTTPQHNLMGQRLPLRRQANVLLRLYDRLLKDYIRPVHAEVLTHIENQLQTRQLNRKYLRRFRRLADSLYTVNNDGSVKRV